MLLNNIYWWCCALFLNLPHKKNIIQLVFTHSPRSGYMITPQGYPRPNFLLSSNVTILPTHLLRFFKKTMCEVVVVWEYLSKKIHFHHSADRFTFKFKNYFILCKLDFKKIIYYSNIIGAITLLKIRVCTHIYALQKHLQIFEIFPDFL